MGTRPVRVKMEMSVRYLRGEESWQLNIQVWRQLVDGVGSGGAGGIHVKSSSQSYSFCNDENILCHPIWPPPATCGC